MPLLSTSDGAAIHYEVAGRHDAPPLLFSNSLGTNLHMWDGQMAAAAERFRVVRYDQRGHGLSAAPERPYSIARLGRDVIDLLDRLDIATAAFCGLSMGGMTGIWLAANRPDRLTRIALCNTSAHVPGREIWDGRIRTVRAGGMAAIREAVLERWFTTGFRRSNAAEVDRIGAMIETTDPRGYIGCAGAIRDMDQRADLPRIGLPTLVLIGEHDPATVPTMGEAIAAAVPGARAVRLPTAHLSNVERPDLFNAAVLPFLAGEAA